MMMTNHSINNLPHGSLIEIVFATKLREVGSMDNFSFGGANIKRLGIGLCNNVFLFIRHSFSKVMMVFSRQITNNFSSLINHIGNVVLGSAEKEMGRIHADRIVALVKNVQGTVKLSMGKLVGNAMGVYLPSVASASSNGSIIASGGTSPQPASGSLRDFFPKAFFQGYWFGSSFHNWNYSTMYSYKSISNINWFIIN